MQHPLADALSPHEQAKLPLAKRFTADDVASPGEEGCSLACRMNREWQMARWTRVFGLFIIFICTVGLQYTFGIMLVEFEKSHQQHAPLLLVVGSFSFGIMDASAVLSGFAIEKLGTRTTCMLGGVLAGMALALSSLATQAWHLVLTYGLILGVGHSLSLFSGILIVNQLFVKRRSLAAALGSLGGGVGTLFWSVLVPYLLQHCGLVWTLRLLAAIVSFCLLCSGFILTDPDCQTEAQHNAPRVRNRGSVQRQDGVVSRCYADLCCSGSLCATRRLNLRLVLLGLFLSAIGMLLPMVTIVKFAMQHGYDERQCARLIFWLGIGSLTFRVPLAYVADRTGPRAAVITSLYAFGALVIAAGCSVGAHYYGVFVFYSINLGGFMGVTLALTPPMMAAMVSAEKSPGAVRETTLAFTLMGLAYMLSSLAGLLFPSELNHAWLMCGVFVLLGAALVHLSSATDSRICSARIHGTCAMTSASADARSSSRSLCSDAVT